LKQKVYAGGPTAKSVLFARWDANIDSPDDELVSELNISVATLRSYRVEWRKERGEGVKRSLVVAEIDPRCIPLETKKGIVWHIWDQPDSEKLKCLRCPIYAECRKHVCLSPHYCYLGCEAVYECELWPCPLKNKEE